MLTLEYAKDPLFADNTGNSIALTVKWAEFNEEKPFCATTYDPMPHGIDLYNRAKAGEFGEIGVFIDPMVATQPQPITTGTQTL